jgi:hypothetical protein
MSLRSLPGSLAGSLARVVDKGVVMSGDVIDLAKHRKPTPAPEGDGASGQLSADEARFLAMVGRLSPEDRVIALKLLKLLTPAD